MGVDDFKFFVNDLKSISIASRKKASRKTTFLIVRYIICMRLRKASSSLTCLIVRSRCETRRNANKNTLMFRNACDQKAIVFVTRHAFDALEG